MCKERQNSTPFHNKNILNKLELEGNNFNIIKTIYLKTILIQWWKTKCFSLRAEIRQIFLLSPLL